jgi:hypothetical protein
LIGREPARPGFVASRDDASQNERTCSVSA